MTAKNITIALVCAVLGTFLPNSTAMAQSREAAVVDSSTNVLNEFMRIPNQGLPRSMVSRAQGIVIIPSMVKVGFIAGVRRGKGIMVIRNEQGAWKPPQFLTMTGGSVGWQIGVQATDVILVFNTRKSVNGLLSGKFTVGVDAAAAAGPVGRQAAAATDGKLQAEIFSYSRSRGLFVGVSVDGAVLQTDAAANQAYYRGAGLMADGTPMAAGAQLPPSASRLLAQLAAYSGAPVSAPAIPAGPPASTTTVPPLTTSIPAPPNMPSVTPPAIPSPTTNLDTTRRELAQTASQLGALLDEHWRNYLALPKAVFSGTGVPTMQSLDESLARFDTVAKDQRYRVLLDRAEFRKAHQLLRQYAELVRALPGPVGRGTSAPHTIR